MRKGLCWLAVLLTLWTTARAEVFIGETPPEDWQERELLRVTVLETGRSDAMLLECGGEAMMIDGGEENYCRAVGHDIKARDITAFKYLLNTHPDNDHISGLKWLMECDYPVGAFLSPFPLDLDDARQRETVEVAMAHGVPWQLIFDGDTLTLGEAEIHLRRCTEVQGRNAQSAVALVTLGEARLLLCADINGLAQRWFLADDREALKADIVKVPHHGITAMVGAFLTAVSPELELITNTREKATSALTQARGHGVPALCSAEGEIVLETDGVDWYVVQHDKQGRKR